MGQKLMSFKGPGNSLSCHSLSVLGMGHGRVKRLADAPEEPSILEQRGFLHALSPPRFLANTRLSPTEPPPFPLEDMPSCLGVWDGEEESKEL